MVNMTIFEALDYIGHSVPYSDCPVQVVCPMHKQGAEINKSARVYPESDTIYCFACTKAWTPTKLLVDVLGISWAQAKTIAGEEKTHTGPRNNLDDQVAELVKICPDNAEEDLLQILTEAAKGAPVLAVQSMINEFLEKYFPRLISY